MMNFARSIANAFSLLTGIGGMRNASLENPTTSLNNPADWLATALGAAPTASGQSVSETGSMRCITVFRCVSIKSGVIANLPLGLYDEKIERGVARAIQLHDNPLNKLVAETPNPYMPSFIWKEGIVMNLDLWGNHYSVIERDGANRVRNLLPIPPAQVGVQRVNKRNKYTVTFSDGMQEIYDQDDILHIPGIGFDGIKGISPISWVGRQSVGNAFALEEFVGRMHANSMRPSGWVELPKGMNQTAFNRLREELESLYAGTGNTGRTLYLDNGAKWNQMGMSLEDAQTLESRRFSVTEICRLFGVPPHLVGEVTGNTSWGTGIEQLTIGFQKFSIDPILTRIEQILTMKLCRGTRLFFQFDRSALTAMDSKTESEILAQGIQNARFTPNDVRRRQGLPPVKGGDTLFVPVNLQPIEMALQPKEPPAPAGTPDQKQKPAGDNDGPEDQDP